MEAISWSTISVNQKLLEVPSDVIDSDGVINHFVPLSNLNDSLRADILKQHC